MSGPQFCEACGARLPADARFCEACGQAVVAAAPGPPAPAPLPGPSATTATAPHGARRPTLALVIVAILITVVGVFVWRAIEQPSKPGTSARPTTATAPVSQPTTRPAPSAAPTAAPTAAATPATAANRPAEAPAAISADELEQLKAAVMEANRAQTAAIFQSSPDVPRLSDALIQSVQALGKGMYRYYLIDGRGTLAQAQAEMESYLRTVRSQELGLSEDTIQFGVEQVAP